MVTADRTLHQKFESATDFANVLAVSTTSRVFKGLYKRSFTPNSDDDLPRVTLCFDQEGELLSAQEKAADHEQPPLEQIKAYLINASTAKLAYDYYKEDVVRQRD